MANPKRRTTRSKRGMRRAHTALKPRSMSVCPECGQSKLPHRVCKCGYYKGVEYAAPQE